MAEAQAVVDAFWQWSRGGPLTHSCAQVAADAAMRERAAEENFFEAVSDFHAA